MNNYLYQAIIIGHINYAEEDRIVRLLTKEHGLISAIAKKSRSSHKKFAGSIDVGNEVLATIAPPNQGELWRLREAKITEGRFSIRKDIHKIALMMYMCEVCSSLSVHEEADPNIFGLLKASLELLEAIPIPTAAFHIGFVAKALAFAGLHPKLKICAHCLHPIRENNSYFQPVIGGAIHIECHKEIADEIGSNRPIPVRAEWLNCVHEILHRPLADSINKEVPSGPQWGLCSSLEHHIEQSLRSKSFLQSLYPS